MIDFDNPTPEQVAQIAAVQQRRLSDLRQLPHWSASQFEEVLFCLQTWSDEHQEWVQDVAHLTELAFDVRLPAAKAQKLQQLIKHWRDTNQLVTVPNQL